MKSYRKLNKTKKNKTRRKRGGAGGIRSYKCPRTVCLKDTDIEFILEKDICICNSCGAIGPSKCFYGDPRVFGTWASKGGEGEKWLKDNHYSNIILH